ncbi:MAG: hypothetical protein HQ582_30690 [Planctomycetes bacterium]|nr:hypothetical protein [Planctomycetota bacterium]
MRSEEHIKSQMSRLSDYLRQEESLIPAAMERLESEAVIPEKNTMSGRIRFRLAATAAAFVLMGIVAVWMYPSSLGAGMAYAEVRQAIRSIESAIVDFQYPARPHENRRVLYRRDTNICRVELPNGIAWVSDPQQGRCLELDENDKTAQVVPGLLEEFSAAEHLDEMASLARDAVEPLGERTVDGRKLIGFRVRRHGEDGKEGFRDTIWVDPTTRLPAIRECTRAATKLVKESSYRRIYTFNQTLAPELFSMTPPDGYRLLSSDAPGILGSPKPALPPEGLPPGPTLKPRIGIGEVTFGMTVEQIVEVLGKADRIGYTRSPTPEESRLIDEAHRKARRLDKFEGQHLIDETQIKVSATVQQREPDATRMKYDSLGIELIVSVEEGLTGGFCRPLQHNNYPYTGETTEGIGLGSTLADIEEVYGEPDGAFARKVRNILRGLRDAVWGQPEGEGNRKSDSFGLWYESRGLHFMISEGKVRYIVFNRGHEEE